MHWCPCGAQPDGRGPDRDGNWELTYLYPSTHAPCQLNGFTNARVDTPNLNRLPNYVSSASVWITPFNGETNEASGWYVYRVSFPVPSMLSSGAVPTGLTVNCQLASDNSTYAILLESPAGSTNCARVSGQQFPVNPVPGTAFEQWWPFSFHQCICDNC
jgi:hypothetical protein